MKRGKKSAAASRLILQRSCVNVLASSSVAKNFTAKEIENSSSSSSSSNTSFKQTQRPIFHNDRHVNKASITLKRCFQCCYCYKKVETELEFY